MGSKKIETPAGTIIVDESFDESNIDPFSMIDPEEKVLYEEQKTTQVQDTLTINGETFKGRIKTYSILENKKTNQKVVKVVLIA